MDVPAVLGLIAGVVVIAGALSWVVRAWSRRRRQLRLAALAPEERAAILEDALTRARRRHGVPAAPTRPRHPPRRRAG